MIKLCVVVQYPDCAPGIYSGFRDKTHAEDWAARYVPANARYWIMSALDVSTMPIG